MTCHFTYTYAHMHMHMSHMHVYDVHMHMMYVAHAQLLYVRAQLHIHMLTDICHIMTCPMSETHMRRMLSRWLARCQPCGRP